MCSRPARNTIAYQHDFFEKGENHSWFIVTDIITLLERYDFAFGLYFPVFRHIQILSTYPGHGPGRSVLKSLKLLSPTSPRMYLRVVVHSDKICSRHHLHVKTCLKKSADQKMCSAPIFVYGDVSLKSICTNASDATHVETHMTVLKHVVSA